MKRLSYPSDLTEKEWAILEPLIPLAKPGGHPRTTDIREVINAILYLDRTGGQWRALPHEFPPWSTVWSYFRTWRNDGTWKRMHTALREQVRLKLLIVERGPVSRGELALLLGGERDPCLAFDDGHRVEPELVPQRRVGHQVRPEMTYGVGHDCSPLVDG